MSPQSAQSHDAGQAQQGRILTEQHAHMAAIEALLDSVHEYFLIRLPPHVRQMYARDLAGYSVQEIRWAIDTYRVSPPPLGHKKTAPKPHDLIALLQQEMAERQIADSLASVIWASIARFGRTQPKAALAHIGADGQEVVRQLGGWELLCRIACAADVNLWSAQLRDKALAVRAQNKQREQAASLGAAMAHARPALFARQDPAPMSLPQAQPHGMAGLADILGGLAQKEAACVR